MANVDPLKSYSVISNNWAVLAGSTVQIVNGSARRIALGFFCADSSPRIYPSGSSISASQIRPAISNTGGLWFLYSDVGVLSQIDWYAFSGIDTTITTLEVIEEG